MKRSRSTFHMIIACVHGGLQLLSIKLSRDSGDDSIVDSNEDLDCLLGMCKRTIASRRFHKFCI